MLEIPILVLPGIFWEKSLSVLYCLEYLCPCQWKWFKWDTLAVWTIRNTS